jgi:hypothetical protein
MDDNEINHKYYENVLLKHSVFYEDTIKAMDIVKRYIIRENLILVGGMAIDLALKLKNPNKGIYDKDVLPDYDFYSHEHYKDAYEIAQWLNRVGLKNISVINAMHPSTIKVRVNFVVVADITYIPKHILDNIPTLRYKQFNIVHPHYQMIDQHRSLSLPYENAPREVILSRAEKDMKRYDILYEEYSLKKLNIKNSKITLSKKYNIEFNMLYNQCISGFVALNYWVHKAKQFGFNTQYNLGEISASKNNLTYTIPLDSHGITIYSDDIKSLYDLIKKNNNIKEERFYSRFLDKIPLKIILDNDWELLENKQKISAYKFNFNNIEINNLYVANLQNIMMYLLVNYILLMKIKNIDRGISFYFGYLLCRDLIIWSSNKYYTSTNQETKDTLEEFFPTEKTYGKYNISESYIVNMFNFNLKNGTASKADKYKYVQPYHVYDRDLKYNKVPKKYYEFSYKDSEIFNFDGEQIDNIFIKKK